jgi:Mg2+-importing ATPase
MDEITLRHHLDPLGNESKKVFELGFLNALHQSGKKNSIDQAIVNRPLDDEKVDPLEKVGEIPFTFENRRSSAIVRTETGQMKLICKGAFEEVLSLCPRISVDGKGVPLTEEYRQQLVKTAADFNTDGYRVILVATRDVTALDMEDDRVVLLDIGMTVEGFLTFLDPPKPDAKASIARLQELGKSLNS